MDQVYGLLVRMSLETTGFTGAAGSALRIFAQMESQAMRTSGAIAGVGKAMGLLAGGAAITGAGLAGIGVMKGWVSAAMQVQDALAGVGLATHQTQQQLEKLGLPQLAYRVAGQTQFSAPDVLHMAQLAATGGINDPRVLMGMLPTLARVAEISNRLKGTSIDETVPALVSIAHQFQAYGAQPGMTTQQAAAANQRLQTLAGRVAQAQIVSSLTPGELEHSLAYLTQAHAGLGLSAEQAIEFTAFASNVGLTGGQGGGARLRAFYQRMAGPPPGTHGPATNAWARGLDAIQRRGGGSFFDAQGKFEGTENAFAVIARASASYGDNQKLRLQAFQAAFGSTGQMVATVGSTTGAQERQAQLAKIFGEDPIAFVARSQQTLNATLTGQLTTLRSNFGSLAAMLGTDLLPPLIAVTHALVGFTSGLMDLLSQQPVLLHAVAAFTAIGTAAALVVGPILAVRGALALLALTSRATAAAEALTIISRGAAPATGALGADALAAGGAGAATTGGAGLLGSLGGLAGVLLPVAAGAAGVYLILTRWKGAMDAAHTAFLGLGDAFSGLGVVAASMGDVFVGIGIQMGQSADYLGKTGLFQHLGEAAHGAAQGIASVTAALLKISPHHAAVAATMGAAATLDPNATLPKAPPLVKAGADPRIPGSTVRAVPQSPATITHTPIFGGTVGINSPLLPLPKINTSSWVGRPVVSVPAARHATEGHKTAPHVPVTINIHTPAGIDARQIAHHIGPIVQHHVQKALKAHDEAQADIFGGYLTAGFGSPQGIPVSLGAASPF